MVDKNISSVCETFMHNLHISKEVEKKERKNETEEENYEEEENEDENRSCACEVICQCLSKTFMHNLNISKEEKEENEYKVEKREVDLNENRFNAARNSFSESSHPELSKSPTNKRKTAEEEEEVLGTKKAKQNENLKICHDQKVDPTLESNKPAKSISSLSLFCIRCGSKFNQLAKLMLHRKSHPTMKSLKGLIVSIVSLKKFSNNKSGLA